MKTKYIEERFPKYFIFGECPDEDKVDVSDGNRDVLIGVTRENAKTMIIEREKIVNFIIEMANAFDKTSSEAFDEFWYGKKDV